MPPLQVGSDRCAGRRPLRLAPALIAALAVLLSGCASRLPSTAAREVSGAAREVSGAARDVSGSVHPASRTRPSDTIETIRTLSTGCARPAPTSARGYARAFAALPSAQWGAADLSISVRLPDGRAVWLFGDTLAGADSAHLTRFVHSTAVVQNRGCFHVSRGGAQILPDDSPRTISWISAGIALDDHHVLVASGQQRLGGTCALCFRAVGLRGAILSVTSTGDVVFDRWLPRWPAWTGKIVWGVGLVRWASTVAMYGISPRGLARRLYVATASVGNAARGRWHLHARPVGDGIDPAGVTAYHDARGWRVVTLRGRSVVRMTAPTPAGPFIERVLGSAPLTAAGQLTYLAAAHPEARLAGGRLLVTVCSNWLDTRPRPLADYRPRYLALAR